jgi:hypothetical protein
MQLQSCCASKKGKKFSWRKSFFFRMLAFKLVCSSNYMQTRDTTEIKFSGAHVNFNCPYRLFPRFEKKASRNPFCYEKKWAKNISKSFLSAKNVSFQISTHRLTNCDTQMGGERCITQARLFCPRNFFSLSFVIYFQRRWMHGCLTIRRALC